MSARDRETVEALARVAAALDGAVLGLGTAALAVASLAKYLAASGALWRIAEAPAVAIPDISYSLLAGLGEGESRLAVVRGLVGSPPGGTFLIPPGSREHCVVTRHTQTCLFGEWRGIFGWTFDLHALFFKSLKEQIITSFRWVPFVLVDPEKSSGMVHVKLDGTVQQPLPLTTVYHKLVPVEQNSYTLFQTIVGNGYPIALLDEEKILPIGKELTAIGLCRVNNRGVEITSCPEIPFFLSDLTKGEMEAEMSSRARAFFWITVALGTVSVGLLGHAIYRFWERVKRHREAREAQERFHQGDNEDDDAVENVSGDDEPGEMGDGQLCVICLRKRRKAAFVPCGHLVCCCNCAKRVILMDEQLCPVCRQDIDHMLRVYDS
ncbi:hypothetical protein ACQ4PT_042073 [Festuca glaucescens]